MNPQKRRPGRPIGASFHNAGDTLHLERIADRMLTGPKLCLTGFMRAVGVTDETAQRRLRRKWNAAPERHMLAARERRHAQARASADEMRRNLIAIGQDLRERWGRIDPTFLDRLGHTALGINAAAREAGLAAARWSAEHPEIVAGLQAISEGVTSFSRSLPGTAWDASQPRRTLPETWPR